MDHPAPPAPQPTQPDPTQDRLGLAMPERLAYLITLVRILLGHGKRLEATVATESAHPRFATMAAAFGTYDLHLILARVKRGMMRLLALETYLLERAAKDRDIAEVPQRVRTPATQSKTPEPPKTEPPEPEQTRPRRTRYDPNSAHIPTEAELAAEVRRRPIGRTIAHICMDLGVMPAFCTTEVWNELQYTLQSYGGSLGSLYKVRGQREKTFRREREKRPETWGWNWHDLRRPTIRQVLVWLIGETPDPPDPIPIAAPA